jgi:hypothetical protein
VRRLMLVLSAVCASIGVALWALLFVLPESALSEREGWVGAIRAQYHDEDPDPVEPPQGATPPRSTQVEPPDTSSSTTGYDRWIAREAELSQSEGPDPVSEGSIAGGRAPAEEISIMEPPAPYSQVVDNASPGAFSELGWKESAGGKAQYYGKDYSYVEPSRVGHPARFRVKIPATDHYTVYARWPDLKGNNTATRFGVSTVSGIEWTKVDQRRDGGTWVRLGAYKMVEGNRNSVQVSGYKATGRVVADAVMVVRGTQMEPPPSVVEVGAGAQAGGEEVVQLARDHMGTPYVHSPPGTCEAHRSEDCSCLTSLVFSELGISVPDHPVGQWGYGRYVAKPDLRPGDLVFFKEAGRAYPITHVGIYSGNGNMIHSSSYWGGVVERPMGSVSGYYGARRLGQD